MKNKVFNHNDFRDDLVRYLKLNSDTQFDSTCNITRFINDEEYTLSPEHYRQLCSLINTDFQDYIVDMSSSRKSADIIICAKTNLIDQEEIDKTLLEVRRNLSAISNTIDIKVQFSSKKI